LFSHININCDLGEIDPTFHLEEMILPYVSMCNIACGGHAGNETSLKSVMKLAYDNNVLIGLHPSYNDPANFGRLSPTVTQEQLRDDVMRQLDKGFFISEKGKYIIHHIKAHGALYHDLSKSEKLSNFFLDLIDTYNLKVKIMGLPNSKLELACHQRDYNYIREGFGDRAYRTDGSLVNRTINGSVYDDIDKITKQAIELHNFKGVETFDGDIIDLEIDSICYHSDAPNSIENLKKLQSRLKQMGIGIYKISK